MIYSLKEKRWLVGPEDRGRAEFNVRGNPPPGRNGHTATLAVRGRSRGMAVTSAAAAAAAAASPPPLLVEDAGEDNVDFVGQIREISLSEQNDADLLSMDQEHQIMHQFDNPNEIPNNPSNARSEDEDAQIVIIGGWLGSGPLAASDMHVLDISCGLLNLTWFQPPPHGTPPGPCELMNFAAALISF